jgi:hypothetical protein
MRKRTWTLLAASAFAVSLAGWFLWVLPAAEKALNQRLPSLLQKTLNTPVSVGRVRLHPFLLRLTFVDVRVGPAGAVVFKSQAWTVDLTPTRLRRTRPWFAFAIGKCRVEKPFLDLVEARRLISSGAEGRRGVGRGPFGYWPILHLEWTQGTVRLPFVPGLPEGADFLSLVDGQLIVTRGGAALEGQGKNAAGAFRLSLRAEEWKQWKATLVQDAVPLATVAAWAPRVPGAWDGALNARIRAQGPWPFRRDSFQWMADGRVQGTVGASKAAAPIPFLASLQMTPTTIRIRQVQLLRTISGGGVWRHPFDEKSHMDFFLKADDFSLAEVQKALAGHPLWGHVPMAGSGPLKVRITGSPSKPRADMHMALSGVRLGIISVPELTGTLAGSRESAQATFGLLGGTVSLSAAGDPHRPRVTARVQNIDLGGWAEANGWGKIDGSLNGQVKLARGPEGPVADGLLSVERLEWGVHRETAPVSARFTYGKGQWKLRGQENALRAHVSRVGDRWQVSDTAFELPSGLMIRARGDIRGPEKRLALKGSLQGLPLRDVPVLLKKYPEIDGHVDFRGALTGTASAPMFQGEVTVHDGRLRSRSPALDGRARLEWDREGFRVSEFDVAGRIHGRASWRSGQAFDLSVKASSAPADWIGDVLGAPYPVTGALSGEAFWSSRAGVTTGSGQITWSRGTWNRLSFDTARADFEMDRGTWHLKTLDIRQPSGELHAEGRWPGRGSREEADVVVQFKRFSVMPLTWDGEVRAQGSVRAQPFEFRGHFHSPLFWVNGFGVGPLKGKLRVDDRAIEVTGLEVGDVLEGRVVVDRARKNLDGRWTVRDMKLKEWGPALSLPHPVLHTGVLRASGRVTGAWSSPQSQFQAQWSDARWNLWPFRASLTGEWSDRVLRLKSFSARFEGGGAANGSGSWPAHGAGPGGQVRVKLTAMPVDRTLESLGLARRWPGVWNGEFSGERADTGFQLAGTLSGGDVGTGEKRVREWRGRLRYQDNQILVDEFVAKTADGAWRVREGSRALLTGGGKGRFQLINEVRNIHLGPLHLFGGVDLAGTWRLGSHPALEASVKGRSFWINQQRFDHDLARMVWSTRKISFDPTPGSLQRISGTLHLDKLPQVRMDNLSYYERNERRFWIHGEAGPGTWNFDLQGENLEAGTLIGLADLDVPVSGLLNVRVSGRGSAGSRHVEGRVAGRDGAVARLPYDRLEGQVVWKGPWIEVQNLEAVRRGGYVLKGGGRFPVNANGQDQASFVLTLADGNLAVLKDVWPECKSADGSLRGEMQFQPGPDGVQMSGHLVVENGRIRAEKYFHQITDLNARLLLRDDELAIETLSGRVGAGRLVVRGKLGLNGLDITEYDVAAESVGREGIEIEAPQLAVPPGPLFQRFSILRKSFEAVSQGHPLVYLKLTGPDGEQRLQGTLILEETQFTYPPSKKRLAQGSVPEWWREFLEETYWDVRFKTGDNTWYRNEFVNVKIRGAMDVTGRRGSILATGRLDAERGVITYLGQSFTVERGVFEVVKDTRPAVADRALIPYLSGQAVRTAPTVDPRGFSAPDTIVMVVDRAPIGELEPRFISRNNPGLSSDRVAKMALGLNDEQVTPLERDQLLRAGLVQLLGSTAGPLATRIANRFGIDILYPIYEPDEDPTAAEEPVLGPVPRRDWANYLKGTGASAGIQLSRRIFGMYKFKVDETQNQYYFRDQVELLYRLRGNLHLRASTELDTERLLGQPPNRQAVLENQWRFGPPRSFPRTESAVPSQEAPSPAP